MKQIITRNNHWGCHRGARCLGPGLLESTYEMCLAEEFKFLGIPFVRQCSFLSNEKNEPNFDPLRPSANFAPLR